MHAGAPHSLATPPPPHDAGAVQPPQSMVSPQPSLMGPHVAPQSSVVRGVHVSVAP